jgi:predicted transcriptional regulator
MDEDEAPDPGPVEETDGAGLRTCAACGALGIGPDVACCDGPMTPVRPAASGPTLEDLLRTVFDMSGAELDVCLCVMEGGWTTAAELADRTDYDRSVVARHLSHLVALEVVERRRQILRSGGEAYVYTPADPADVRRRFRERFLRWAAAGATRIDELSREKVEAIVEGEDDAQWTVFREP